MPTGLVRSPLLTTALQVSSRLFLIYPVVAAHPEATTPSIFYTTMLLAWSVTEVIRYSYFVLNLQSRGVPDWLMWLRYNTFYVLYPVGIASECVLVWKASQDIQVEGREAVGAWERAGFWAVLVVYVPGMIAFFFAAGEWTSHWMRCGICAQLCRCGNEGFWLIGWCAQGVISFFRT